MVAEIQHKQEQHNPETASVGGKELGEDAPVPLKREEWMELVAADRAEPPRITRQWCMPSRNTFLIKPITALLKDRIRSGHWLDPFAGDNVLKGIVQPSPRLRLITNDLNPDLKTDCHMDALEFLQQFEDGSTDGVVYDPPYSPRQVSECYRGFGREVTMETTQASFWKRHKDEMSRIVRPGGTVICFGWNSMGCGKNRGFWLEEILLVPHGGSHNDTLCTVEVKL